MKDRIRQIMESQHMTQQVFAEFLGTTPATLSGIFNDRTRPTINIVEAIKKKIPDINTDWLLFGHGSMYKSSADDGGQTDDLQSPGVQTARHQEPSFFDFPSAAPSSSSPSSPTASVHHPGYGQSHGNGGRQSRQDSASESMKYFDKMTRHVTEIRVYYDDQTWESFVPSKK